MDQFAQTRRRAASDVLHIRPLRACVEQMLKLNRPFDEIEDWIEEQTCSDEIKSALWLWAWADRPLAERRAVIEMVLGD